MIYLNQKSVSGVIETKKPAIFGMCLIISMLFSSCAASRDVPMPAMEWMEISSIELPAIDWDTAFDDYEFLDGLDISGAFGSYFYGRRWENTVDEEFFIVDSRGNISEPENYSEACDGELVDEASAYGNLYELREVDNAVRLVKITSEKAEIIEEFPTSVQDNVKFRFNSTDGLCVIKTDVTSSGTAYSVKFTAWTVHDDGSVNEVIYEEAEMSSLPKQSNGVEMLDCYMDGDKVCAYGVGKAGYNFELREYKYLESGVISGIGSAIDVNWLYKLSRAEDPEARVYKTGNTLAVKLEKTLYVADEDGSFKYCGEVSDIFYSKGFLMTYDGENAMFIAGKDEAYSFAATLPENLKFEKAIPSDGGIILKFKRKTGRSSYAVVTVDDVLSVIAAGAE